MNVTPETLSFAQREYLYELFAAETNYGLTGPNTGTNTTGKLATVSSLGRRSIWPDFRKLPFVGVQLLRSKEYLYSSGRKHRIVTTLNIGVAVDAVATPDGVVKVDDAYEELEALIDDGNGKGVMPIVRDHKNFTLGSTGGVVNAAWTLSPDITYNWDKAPQAKGVLYYAYAVITLQGTVFLHV